MRTTKYFHNALHLFVLMLTLLSSGPLLAQGLDPATIANPPADSWPSYHGDYSGRRHSPLTQITPQNVRSLTLAWAFQTGQPAALKSRPFWSTACCTSPCRTTSGQWMRAPDIRSGITPIPRTRAIHIGHRGVAMYRDWLYFTTPDAHLISLDAKNGKVRWNVQIADNDKGYWSTMSPLVVRDHVIVGVSR